MMYTILYWHDLPEPVISIISIIVITIIIMISSSSSSSSSSSIERHDLPEPVALGAPPAEHPGGLAVEAGAPAVVTFIVLVILV